jgi:hypothetical protein
MSVPNRTMPRAWVQETCGCCYVHASKFCDILIDVSEIPLTNPINQTGQGRAGNASLPLITSVCKGDSNDWN